MINNPLMNMQYIISEYNKFINNPTQWLTARNMNNPQEMLQNPQGEVQNMINSGVMNNQQLNWIMSMAQMMRGILK